MSTFEASTSNEKDHATQVAPLPQFALRASVVGYCNMACVYCPQPTQEDLTPPRFRNRGLNHDGYVSILTHLLHAVPFEKVCFTGGEPLLNPRLDQIVRTARPIVTRVELNTNAVLLTEARWGALEPYLDQLKISIDTVDHAEFKEVTKFRTNDGLDKVFAAIDLVRDSRVELVLNGVVMHRTLPRLLQMIEYVIDRRLVLHLLDFNYTEPCRETWEEEFVPNEYLMEILAKRFGGAFEVPRFGCGYYEYYPTAGGVIRVRTSFSGSMRSGKCDACQYYCQTGIFGLRLSSDGWVTYCYSTAEEDGVLLDEAMSTSEVYEAIAHLVQDVSTAVYVPDSFGEMVRRLKLNPRHITNIAPVLRNSSH